MIKKNQTITCIYISLFVLLSIAMFYKCHFGIADIDESFYLTIPYRFAKGDAMFYDEWHLSQMSGFLLLPLMKLFLFLNNGNTERIVIFFRYAYTMVQIASSVVIFHMYKKRSLRGAMIGSILVMLFAPYGITALSYNSIGLITMALATAIVTCSNNRLLNVIAGIVFSCSVLCCPYLVVLYVVFTFFIFIKKDRLPSILSLRKWFDITLGIAIMVIVFFVFLFSRSSLSDIFKSIPYILDDPEHKSSFILKILKLIYSIFIENPCNVIVIISYSLVLIMAKKETNREKKEKLVPILFVIAIVHLVGYIVFSVFANFLNHLSLPIVYLTVFIHLIFPDEQKDLYIGAIIPILIYGVCIQFSSNQNLYSISVAVASSLCACSVYISIFLRGLHKQVKFAKPLFIIFMISLLSVETYYRLYVVWWENTIKNQVIEVCDGINKDIFVSEVKYDSHIRLSNEVKNNIDDNNVLFLSKNTFLYLLDDYNVCSYSAWPSGINDSTINRLVNYYSINPYKIPTTVFIEKGYESYIDVLSEKLNLVLYKTLDRGYLLTKKHT